MIRWIFIVAGILLILDTVFIRTRSNWNLGVLLPALLGTPLLVYGLFKQPMDIWFAHGVGLAVKWVFICGYIFLVAIILIFSIMMGNAAGKLPDAGADAVIVLGGGIKGDQVSYALQNRLDKAAEYYNENPNAVIVVSGGLGVGKEVTEAYAMEKYLKSIGVPTGAILKEERSTSTNENFRYSKELLDERLGSEDYRVVYVTNDFHILRAGINAREEGLDAQGFAAPTPFFIIPNSYAREALALLATYAFGVRV